MLENTDLHASIPQSNLVAVMEARIYDAITAGQLRPGQRIVEAELARRLRISRAPIREAARRLENRGLLSWIPRRGFFVRRLTPENVLDIYGLRIAIEGYAIRIAAMTATTAQLAELNALLESIRTLGTDQDIHRLVEVDLEFHRMICRMTGNARLLSAFEGLTSELRLALSLVNRGFETGDRMSKQHAALVEAIRDRDPELAAAELVRHLEHSCAVVRKATANDMDDSRPARRPPARRAIEPAPLHG